MGLLSKLTKKSVGAKLLKKDPIGKKVLGGGKKAAPATKPVMTTGGNLPPTAESPAVRGAAVTGRRRRPDM
jgi:hypothetical protein